MKCPIAHFHTSYVIDEMKKRNYKVRDKSIINFTINQPTFNLYYCAIHRTGTNIYPDWHNERYLKQCLFNLQEKYDCGGISKDEWKKIEEKFGEYLESNSELEELREFKRTHQPLYIDQMSC